MHKTLFVWLTRMQKQHYRPKFMHSKRLFEKGDDCALEKNRPMHVCASGLQVLHHKSLFSLEMLRLEKSRNKIYA